MFGLGWMMWGTRRPWKGDTGKHEARDWNRRSSTCLDRPESVSMPKCFCWHLVETATTHCQHQHTFFCGIPRLQSVRYPGQGSCFSQVRVKHRFPTLQELGRHPQRCAFHFFWGDQGPQWLSTTIYIWVYWLSNISRLSLSLSIYLSSYLAS